MIPSPRRFLGALALGLLVAACAGPQIAGEHPAARSRHGRREETETVSLKEREARAQRRLRELRERQREGASDQSLAQADIEGRYQELLERPGTPEERKPELLLRLAEFAYRTEEAALRQVYESGEDPDLPPAARYVTSIAYYRRLVDLYPGSPQALTGFYNLGYLYAETGDDVRSAWAYGQVLERDPDTPYGDEIHMRLGETRFEADDVAGAVPHYRAVIARGRVEYVPKALYKLGWCYYNLEDYAAAIEVFTRVLLIDGPAGDGLRRETLAVLTKCFLERGGVAALAAHLEQHPALDPLGDQLFEMLGDEYLEASRYPEAVAAYKAGAEAYPTSGRCLWMERGLVRALLILQDREAVAARRESWFERYGPGSPWDRRHGAGALASERDRMVEEGLRLAVLYRQGRAQRGEAGFDPVLATCRRYLEWFGAAAEEGYEVAYAMARALQGAELLERAAAEYAVVAHHPVWTSHREDASYRRIQVLGTLFRANPSFLESLVTAHEEYAELNPDSPHRMEVLFAAGELLFGAERFAAARGVFERLAGLPDAGELGRQAAEFIAKSFFREGQFARAEAAARAATSPALDLAAAARLRQLAAFSIFKQGEALEAAADRTGANRHYLRLADDFPGEEAAQTALYRAAENLRALQREQEAVRVYERLARAYQGSEYARNALALSAQLYASLGDWPEVARNYEELYRSSPGSATAADILFRAARAWERVERWQEATRLYAEFSAAFPRDTRAAEALYREGSALLASGDEGAAAGRFRRAWLVPSTEEGDVYRARSALALGGMSLARFRDVQLRGDLAGALERKEALLEESLQHLVRAASLPYLESVTEALYEAGQALEHLKEALLTSERPPGLTAEEGEEYTFLLEQRTFPLEERAISYYRKGVLAAQRGGSYTPWVERMLGRLELLLPWAYRRAEEPSLAWDVVPLPKPYAEARL